MKVLKGAMAIYFGHILVWKQGRNNPLLGWAVVLLVGYDV
jgi:hypothetical protein